MFKVGEVFTDKFVVTQVLGGPGLTGEGEVYLIRDVENQDTFVVKTSQERFSPSTQWLRQVTEEAAHQWLQVHQNVVEYRGNVEVNGKSYMVLEHLMGTPIDVRLEALDFCLHDFIDWSAQIADVLAFIQEKGWLYSDVTGKNIVVCPNNTIKFLDFGQLHLRSIASLKMQDERALFRDCLAFGKLMLRMYNLGILAHSVKGIPMDAWPPEVTDQMKGWQNLGDQNADDLFLLGGTIQFLYSDPMPPDWATCKSQLKTVIRTLLRAMGERKEVNFREFERSLHDVHSCISDTTNCALQAAEFDDQKPDLTDLRKNGLDASEEIVRLGDLAERRFAQSLDNRAFSLGRAANRLARMLFGEQSFEFAQSLTRLGLLYGKAGSLDKAIQNIKLALEIDRKRSGEKSQDFAASLHNLANVLQEAGCYLEAEDAYTQALKIKREVLPKGHPSTANSLSDLARLYVRLKRHSDATSLLKESIAIYKEVYGEAHPYYIDDCKFLDKIC
jgi:tetratricopeptide (TPR) repeat protein